MTDMTMPTPDREAELRRARVRQVRADDSPYTDGLQVVVTDDEGQNTRSTGMPTRLLSFDYDRDDRASVRIEHPEPLVSSCGVDARTLVLAGYAIRRIEDGEPVEDVMADYREHIEGAELENALYRLDVLEDHYGE